MKRLSPQTLFRLSQFQNLTNNERDMLEGINHLMRQFGKSYVFKNNAHIQQVKRKLADNYIENMKQLDNNSNYNSIKKSLINKKRRLM